MSMCTDDHRERESPEISSSSFFHLPSKSSFIVFLFFVVFLLESSIRLPSRSKQMLPLRAKQQMALAASTAAVHSACVTVALHGRIFATSVIVFHFILCVFLDFPQIESHKLIPLCGLILSVQALLTPPSKKLLTASIRVPASMM